MVELIRRLLGRRARGNQRLLVDVRQVLGDRAQIRATDLLTALRERRPIYATWSPADLVEQLAELDIPLTGQGRERSIRRAAVVAACEK